MKKITLNETDLTKIVNKVLNEQEIRQFDEDEIDILHFIFKRELKPPFRTGEKTDYGDCTYYNRDGEYFGVLQSDKTFITYYQPFGLNIRYKVCSALGLPYDTWDWWDATKPHLKSWMEDQLKIKLRKVG